MKIDIKDFINIDAVSVADSFIIKNHTNVDVFDEYILSFDDYKKFHEFQMKYFNDFLCFGNLQLETLNKWNEESSKAKILYFDFDYHGK